MIKIFVQDLDSGGSEFEVAAVPRRGEVLLIEGRHYRVRDVRHTLADRYTNYSITLRVELESRSSQWQSL